MAARSLQADGIGVRTLNFTMSKHVKAKIIGFRANKRDITPSKTDRSTKMTIQSTRIRGFMNKMCICEMVTLTQKKVVLFPWRREWHRWPREYFNNFWSELACS